LSTLAVLPATPGHYLRLHFVRSGTSAETDGRCIGQTDAALSRIGQKECRQLSRQIPLEYATYISSDLQRARATAQMLTQAPVIEESRLREMHFGDWEGKTWETLEAEVGSYPGEWTDEWTTVRPPGGESFDDVVTRVSDWLAALPRDGGDYLVVAHAGSIRAAAVVLLEIPMSRAFSLSADHAHVSTFELTPKGASLIRWNSPGF
jgi:broad specificity phosphatase PhoE